MEEDIKMIEEIENIKINLKNRLGANFIEETEEILLDIFKEMSSIASNVSHLKKGDKRLYPYIKDAVIAKYFRLGSEGMNSKSEGSQSSSFIDIEEKLRNDIIKAGLRRLP